MAAKNFYLFFILTVFSGFSTATSAAITSKIVGGQKSIQNQWPWVVALVKSGYDNYSGQFCGGSLVNSSWVVTAAHCLQQKKPNEIRVVYHSLNLINDPGQSLPVKRIVIHPKFNLQTVSNDIALLQLKSPITHATTLPLVTGDPTLVNVNAIIIGWGALSEWDSEFSVYPEQLYNATLPIVSNSQCKNAYSTEEINDTMLCAGLANASIDTCTGDSGGPLVIRQNMKWHLAGITSWGNGCATPGYYGVYTRVSKYVGYVNNTMKINYIALADANHDKLIDGRDKTKKYSDLKTGLQTWIKQCWSTKAPCANVNSDGFINQSDYLYKNNRVTTDYKYWLDFYWQPEMLK